MIRMQRNQRQFSGVESLIINWPGRASVYIVFSSDRVSTFCHESQMCMLKSFFSVTELSDECFTGVEFPIWLASDHE